MKIIIKQKTQGTGNIHDLASDEHDRVLHLPRGKYYIVLLPAYYGGRGYSTHATEELAAQEAQLLQKLYPKVIIKVIDGDLNVYVAEWGKLWAQPDVNVNAKIETEE